MPQYDPNDDTPFGLGSADFPVTFYDRPQLMFGNLLRGDVDGMTRAMLSPDTLTPSQIKTVRDVLLKGVMKTILDIATNPLVIIGLIASLKFPMGSTKVLLDIHKGLLPKAAAMGKTMGGLHGALMKLRTIPGAFENLLGIVRGTEDFTTKYGVKANAIFANAGAVSKGEGYLISARLDGLHKTSHYMVKALRNEPEWLAFMGSKDVPIAANIQKAMRPELIGASDKLRGWYNSIREKLTSNPKVWENIKRSVEKKGLRVGETVEDYYPHSGNYNKYYQARLRGSTGVEYRKYLRKEVAERVGREEVQRLGGMFPNVAELKALENSGVVKKGFTDSVVTPVLNRWSREASTTASSIWDDIAKLGLDESQQRIEFVSRMREYYTKGAGKNLNFVGRLGSKKMADETLDAMAGALQNAKFKGPGVVQKELFEIGKVLAEPAQYSLDPWKTTQRYLNSVASDYAYHGTGYGENLMKIVRTPGVFKNEPHIETYLMDNLIPHVLGYKAWPQLQRSLGDAVRKDKILGWIKNHPMVEQTLGKDKSKVLMDYFAKSGSLSGESIGGQVANWFHISTLGLNLSATSANAMQTFITTVNNVGPQGIWRGLNGVGGEAGLLQKVPKYFEAVAKGANSRVAFKTAFPEFVAEMGEWSKSAERLVSGDVAASGLPKLFKAKGVWDKIKGYMMLPFSTTEAGNQLLAFYSGRNQHLFNSASKLATATGPARSALSAEAGKVGGSLALLTQFAGGPLGIPSSIMNMNPMWRQYMHFPMRYLSYLHGSLRMGTDPSKLDWGTIGRALAGSTAGYIAARNLLGLDLSRGLMVGAMPVPGYEKSPFYPLPLVPPAVSVIGEAGKALLTGETKQLGGVAAMLAPGGIALRRAYRSLSPRYADYENPTPDARIPLYNDDKALVGTLSPMELTLRALGLRPMGVAAEQGAAKWMLSQRDRVRRYRREYVHALFENDTRKAEQINEDFQKAYPEFGPLQIKKSDITALKNRREISRLQRIVRGMPKAYRPIFSQIIGEASLARMTEGVSMGNAGALQNYFPPQ